ncbi:acetylglutamate kinase [Oceanobacillus manasiensis]|uniref:acetylglutamate kinase n=1 Tax=Oceanobacillus manasiensis TaxID=586413 RepID=UPI0005A7353D|nr:acetylglutamate kinase [Oceanobacillus manasiensis]
MQLVVLKLGGSILGKLPTQFYRIIGELLNKRQCLPIIVHGGGPAINQMLDSLHIPNEKVDGLRVTTNSVLEIAEMVMSGQINKQIVSEFQLAGVNSCGLSGVDGKLLQSVTADETGKLGFVGEVEKVNTEILTTFLEAGVLPVISPIGTDLFGQHYNINGDSAATAIAQALEADLVFVSDVDGVMEEVHGQKVLLSALDEQQIYERIACGNIYGGMIPKVEAAIKGLVNGVKRTSILNGLKPEDIVAFINGESRGTSILLRKETYDEPVHISE